MSKLKKPIVLALVIFLGFSILPPNEACADSRTVDPGGVQSSIYAGGQSKVEYYTENSNGTQVNKTTYYGYGEMKINFTVDINALVETLSLWDQYVGF